jgi:hypothetical protein
MVLLMTRTRQRAGPSRRAGADLTLCLLRLIICPATRGGMESFPRPAGAKGGRGRRPRGRCGVSVMAVGNGAVGVRWRVARARHGPKRCPPLLCPEPITDPNGPRRGGVPSTPAAASVAICVRPSILAAAPVGGG